MISLRGGLIVSFESDREVSYAEIESALNGEGFLTDFSINRTELQGRTQFQISVHVPMSTITADGVPPLEAVQTMTAVTNAIRQIDEKRSNA